MYDLESERRVLSSMLNSEDSCIEAYNSLSAADFYSPQHGTIYELICSLFEREIKPTYLELIKEGHIIGMFSNTQDTEDFRTLH